MRSVQDHDKNLKSIQTSIVRKTLCYEEIEGVMKAYRLMQMYHTFLF